MIVSGFGSVGASSIACLAYRYAFASFLSGSGVPELIVRGRVEATIASVPRSVGVSSIALSPVKSTRVPRSLL